MEMLLFGAVGFLIGLIICLIIGPFVVYGISRIVGFENPSLLRSLLFWIILLAANLVLSSVANLIFPITEEGNATFSYIRMLITTPVSLVILISLTRYWYKASWRKVILASFMLHIAQGAILFLAMLITMLIYGSKF